MSRDQHTTDALARRARRLTLAWRVGQVTFWSCVVALLLWMAPFVPLGLTWDDYWRESEGSPLFHVSTPAAETVLLGLITILTGVGSRLCVVAAAGARIALATWRAYHDDLTGLPNRRYFYERVEEGLGTDKGQPFSVIILDVDLLKVINDRHGHVTGDLVLRQVAATLEDQMRPQDLIIRMWGDEFLVVAPRTNAVTAGLLAHRLCAYVAAEPQYVDGESGERVQVTLSSGVATQDSESDMTADDLIRLADFRMYGAKKTASMEREAARGQAEDTAPRGLLAAGAWPLVSQLGTLVASGASLEQKLERISEETSLATGYDVVYVDVLPWRNEGREQRSIIGWRAGWLDRWHEGLPSPEDDPFVREVAESRRPIVLAQLASDPRFGPTQQELLARARIQSAAVVPMLYEDELLGLLVAASRRADAFSEKDVNVLFAIASQLAPVLKNALLLEQLRAAASDLESAYHYTVTVLANVAEARDPYTGNHLRRIRTCSEALATELGLGPQHAREIGLASLLHDLGKVHLPDSVLAKRGALTTEEWKVIKVHPLVGEDILGPSPLFKTAREIARWHHERWDGSGYPDGLSGANIPLPARIVAVADSFDALISERPYKKAWPLNDAVAEIIARRGQQYCPSVVDAFERLRRSGGLRALAQTAAPEPLPDTSKAA